MRRDLSGRSPGRQLLKRERSEDTAVPVFAQKPLLVKGDGPIMKMRAWYSQFYSEPTSMAAESEPVAIFEKEISEVSEALA